MSDEEFRILAEEVSRILTGTSALTVRVEECGADGTCSRNGNGWTVIRIRPGLDEEWRLKVLFHELAHAVLHWPVMEALPHRTGGHFSDPVFEKQAQELADDWLKRAKEVAFDHFAETKNTQPSTSEFYETILRALTYV